PQRALYGQKSIPTPRATASSRRSATPNVDVVFCLATTSARACGVGAALDGRSASSEIVSSCLSIFLSCSSQLVMRADGSWETGDGSARGGAARRGGTRGEPPATDDGRVPAGAHRAPALPDRKSTRLNSSHVKISYAVFCLK